AGEVVAPPHPAVGRERDQGDHEDPDGGAAAAGGAAEGGRPAREVEDVAAGPAAGGAVRREDLAQAVPRPGWRSAVAGVDTRVAGAGRGGRPGGRGGGLGEPVELVETGEHGDSFRKEGERGRNLDGGGAGRPAGRAGVAPLGELAQEHEGG